ncbi:synergin gamma-like [Chelonus insularis]|uniref:synergin gamma-like n=1 Tax=Chelonus insularis TaxID=460826 RepID=UPI0015892C3D|nr:synergin gamma-like [Chelonus insularis]
MNKSRTGMDKKHSQLPGWLWPTSNALPPVYKRIWEFVKEDRPTLGAVHGELLVDTNKVFPLLLTSQLPTEVLGYIWSLANQKYAGQLTEQELYIVLALIAIAQTSYAFTNLDVLHMLPGPPIPRLNLNILYSNIPKSEATIIRDSFPNENQYKSSIKNHDSFSSPALSSSIINTSCINEPKIDNKISSGSTKRLLDEKLSGLNHGNNTQISSTSDFDDFSDFQSAPIAPTPSIPMWDSKQGSAIGSRLANHNLSGGKFVDKKKPNGKLSNQENSPVRINSLNSSGLVREKSPDRTPAAFPKCTIKNQSKTVILKDTIIRNGETVQQVSTDSREFSDKIPEPLPLPKVPPPRSSEASAQDLMSLQQVEDKYSALRNLIDESTIETSTTSVVDSNSTAVDDFGDFVSAEHIEPTFNTVQSSVDTSLDLFSDFEQFLPSNSNDKSQISFAQETIEAFAQLEITASPEKSINFLEEKYEMTIDPEKVIAKEDTISENSLELGNNTIMTRSNSVPSLDLKCFLPSVGDEDKDVETMNQSIYWEWKQYMETCVQLLQVSASIFTSITSEVVLHEVLNSAQGYNFLCNLAEVAAVCRRVNFSHKEMDINIMGFDDLLMDIDKIWAEMEPFYVNIPIVTELPTWPQHQGDSSACALCLTVITSGKVVHNDNSYHVTCANLWLNCINNNLPALRHVSSHGHTAVTAASSQI